MHLAPDQRVYLCERLRDAYQRKKAQLDKAYDGRIKKAPEMMYMPDAWMFDGPSYIFPRARLEIEKEEKLNAITTALDEALDLIMLTDTDIDPYEMLREFREKEI